MMHALPSTPYRVATTLTDNATFIHIYRIGRMDWMVNGIMVRSIIDMGDYVAVTCAGGQQYAIRQRTWQRVCRDLGEPA